jgi:methyl-accepting chemotaxis protein
VTTLQFQDLATQLLGHVHLRMDTLSQVVGGMQNLAAEMAVPVTSVVDESRLVQSLRQAHESLAAIVAQVQQTTTRNPVRQQSMATGDIELF